MWKFASVHVCRCALLSICAPCIHNWSVDKFLARFCRSFGATRSTSCSTTTLVRKEFSPIRTSCAKKNTELRFLPIVSTVGLDGVIDRSGKTGAPL